MMDRGPWQVIEPDDGKHDWVVGSDDFTHDVWLYVTGDFADDDQRRRYCEWLAQRLNRYEALDAFHAFFRDRCESLFADHGMEVVNLYNAASKRELTAAVTVAAATEP